MEWEHHHGQDSLEPERSLVDQGCQESIKNFWLNSNHNPSDDFIPDPDDVWRCWTCGRGYKSERSLKSHITHMHTERKLRGCTADKEARNQMQKDEQDQIESRKSCVKAQKSTMSGHSNTWSQDSAPTAIKHVT